jgi:protein phosphatase
VSADGDRGFGDGADALGDTGEMLAPRLWAWAGSDPGRRRERNEDSYLIEPDVGVLAVADGMGGHQGGATASRMAVEYVSRELREAKGDFEAALRGDGRDQPRATEPMEAVEVGDLPTLPQFASRALIEGTEITPLPGPPPGPGAVASAPLELMRLVVRRASTAIFEAATGKPELRGMGTTLTAGLVHRGVFHLVHAGDSRCYLYRGGQLRQLTDDHSWIAEQLRAGAITEAEAKHSKFRHVITRSIGFERDAEADLKAVPVQPGDVFVLCSDGMSNYVDHAELGQLVGSTPCRRLPQTLIDLANSRGGDDNITVVVGLVALEPPPL